MKNQEIKDAVAKGLSGILLSLRINTPSRKTKSYFKKITKKIAKQLKSDVKKMAKQKKKNSPTKVAKVKAKRPARAANRPSRKR